MLKDEDVEILLQSLSNRPLATRWGLSKASEFVAGKDFGLDGEAWQKELESAARRVTYASDDFVIKSTDGLVAKDGVLLEFDAICSSRRKDRDGDVIETKGLEIDPAHPLLFQHSQNACIGAHKGIIAQTENLWSSKYAIGDTELGRDAAVLVKMGALRVSIGFRPTEFEPLAIVEDASGAKYASGWHIKKAQVMETSLVSVPANSDARVLATYAKELDGLCTAYSRNELKHEAVKHWAKGLYEKRPVQVQGADMSKGMDAIQNKDTMGGELPTEQMGTCPECKENKFDATGTCQACGHIKDSKSVGGLQTKDTEVPATKGLSYHPKGSFEQVQDDLDRSARKYLRSKGVIDEDDYGWTSLYATFTDKAVVAMYEGEGKYKCYSLTYKTENGVAQWTGDATEVDVEPSIISKKFESRLSTKTLEQKEVIKEVTVEATKEHTLDELRKMFVAKAVVSGIEGYKAVKEVAELHEAANYSRAATELFN